MMVLNVKSSGDNISKKDLLDQLVIRLQYLYERILKCKDSPASTDPEVVDLVRQSYESRWDELVFLCETLDPEMSYRYGKPKSWAMLAEASRQGNEEVFIINYRG